jgi:hypothetical protein
VRLITIWRRSRNRRHQCGPGYAKTLDAISDQVLVAVTLDMVMPNGKKLRDCTGTECIGFGQQFIRLGEHVGDRVVGEVVKSDAKVVKIVFGATD